MQPGDYEFRQNSTFGAVRQVLAPGPDVFTLGDAGAHPVRGGSGGSRSCRSRTAGSFADALKGGTVTSAFSVPGTTNLEGTIGAGEYTILPGRDRARPAPPDGGPVQPSGRRGPLVAAAGQLGYTPAQLVIVASIVEKEGVYDKNMGKVSRVIYNRLAKGSPLQMDSTVLYSLGQDGGTVTPADLQLPTPYNTYLHTGLPPTADLHAVGGGAGRGGRPDAGRLALLRARVQGRNRAVLGHLRRATGR